MSCRDSEKDNPVEGMIVESTKFVEVPLTETPYKNLTLPNDSKDNLSQRTLLASSISWLFSCCSRQNQQDELSGVNWMDKEKPIPAKDTRVQKSKGQTTSNGRDDKVPTPNRAKRVTLLQVPRGCFTPTVSPFGLRLETFLRVAGIKHDIKFTTFAEEMHTPWLRIDNEEISGQAECITALCRRFKINLKSHASDSTETTARLVEGLFENKIFWGVALWRWVFDGGKSITKIQYQEPMSERELLGIRDTVIVAAFWQGIGRASQEEMERIVTDALLESANALENNSYFMGNSPGEVDCLAFSLLVQMVWNMPGSPFETTVKEIKPLMDYVTRMKESYWPDWDQLLIPIPLTEQN